MFTKGIEVFDKAYESKSFDKVYTTNLTYYKDEYNDRPWLEQVDCSLKVAKVINSLNTGKSLTRLINDNNATSDSILKRVKSM